MPMSLLNEAKQHIFEVMAELTGNDSLVNDIIIDYPPETAMGDLSIACFILAKLKKISPSDLAKDLAMKIKADGIIAKAEALGPYLNFFLQEAYLARVGQEINDLGFGLADIKGGRVMIEYSNANTHKEYHIGHLRNVCYGDAVAKILSAVGQEVINVSYINDFGIHVAKTLWQLKKSQAAVGGGYILGRLYSQASQALETDGQARAEVAEIMKNVEAREGEDYELWQTTRQWSIDYFAAVYERLGIKFKNIFYESAVIAEGRELVSKLLEQGILIKSRGAVIADLTLYNLGVLVFLRSDGTALYPVADLALAAKKFADFKLDESLYVVDKRQGLYFDQLFKVLALAGWATKARHLGYDFVRLPEGAMSSREGRVVTFDDVYNETKTKIQTEINSRHSAWPEKKVDKIAEALTVGVLKFEMIKVGADKIITFNIKEALRFDGFTSIYVHYAVARINSVLKKAKLKVKPGALLNGSEDIRERTLLLLLAKFNLAVSEAARNYDPAVLAKYLFDLSQQFNDYYQNVPILQSAEPTQKGRLGLILAIKQVLTKGLAILGIETVDEM